ncbi:hypothetical protein BpHYR1_024607 [Brachionus plicatilis]|uniref:Uncharacterized protein n=1 Tax=Brachionus plicatilis TaxID=10195 RepID=A0A3M7SR41_BRAPC|nr:hypothetical protein BpHYR1_024607 [Brachionus plicatilis]
MVFKTKISLDMKIKLVIIAVHINLNFPVFTIMELLIAKILPKNCYFSTIAEVPGHFTGNYANYADNIWRSLNDKSGLDIQNLVDAVYNFNVDRTQFDLQSNRNCEFWIKQQEQTF